jgi:hypothetical protein
MRLAEAIIADAPETAKSELRDAVARVVQSTAWLASVLEGEAARAGIELDYGRINTLKAMGVVIEDGLAVANLMDGIDKGLRRRKR